MPESILAHLKKTWPALLVVAILSVSGGPARAEVPATAKLVIGQLPCGPAQGAAESRNHGIRQWMWELMKRTSVEAELEAVAIDPDSRRLFEYPMLVWSCAGEPAPFSPAAEANLREHLGAGGFWLIDDPLADPRGPFSTKARQFVERLWPQTRLKEIPFEDVMFHSFFLIDRLGGRRLQQPGLEGLYLGERLALVFSHNDLLGALARDWFGHWESACEPDGEAQRERSFRLAINIVLYALCLDYKNDRVHLPFILKRRRH